MKISVICASKNEEVDILLLLNSYEENKDAETELIIIDDSTDQTKNVVKKFIDQKKNNTIGLIDGDAVGCCLARNKGILSATGDYICFMTADSYFSDGYFRSCRKSIVKHEYPDALMTKSAVENKYRKYIFPEFIEFVSDQRYSDKNFIPKTSQGYLVKKEAAIEAGLIDAKCCGVNVCRDYTLVEKMLDCGFTHVLDRNLKVFHKPPINFVEFYENQKTRGIISGGNLICYKNFGFIRFCLRLFLKSLLFIFKGFFSEPFLYFKSSKSKNSKKFKFVFINIIKKAAFLHGEFSALYKLKIVKFMTQSKFR